MRTLRFLLQKEFRQIFRDPSILRIIFVMPMIQLLILPWAADYEVTRGGRLADSGVSRLLANADARER